MKKVRVKGEGVKLANKWCYINDEAIIDEEEYEKNKEYVDVIEEIGESELPEDNNPKENQNPEGEKTSENNEDVDDTNVGDNAGDGKESEDEELEALKQRAKELKINVTANMKKETIIKKIEEAENVEENQNPEGE